MNDRHPRKLAVLAFHKIGAPPAHGWDTWFYISASSFEGHLQWLQRSSWRVIDAQTFLTALASPDAVPHRSVLLTFDDAYRSMRQVALPALLAYGCPAVLFVPTGFVGLSNSFDNGSEPDEPICDWDDLSELQEHGISIQSHSVSHQRFSELSRVQRERELIDSKAVLESRLGTHVDMFSYPYGDTGSDEFASAAALQRAGYKVGCLYGGGPNPVPLPDAYRIQRVPMGPDTDLMKVLDEGVC